MLELRSLRHVVALHRRLNFARAAEDLGISQSALSRSLQSIERQLGVRLFDRDRAGVAPTPQGLRAVKRANVLLADAEDLERQLVLSAQGEAGRVRFGMVPIAARALLPSVVSERLSGAPDVTNEVVVRDVDALWDLLVIGEIEFFIAQEGIAYDAPPSRIEKLGAFPLNLIVRAGHPLLYSACLGETFPVVRASWAGLPLPPEILHWVRGETNVIEDFGSLAAITSSSDAIWFSSTYAVAEELAAGQLRQLPQPKFGQPHNVQMVMYTLERRSQSRLVLDTKRSLRTAIRNLAKRSAGQTTLPH